MQTFRFSEDEARRMRRGVYLFPLIIMPFVAVFGLDASKSQPTHFLIVLSIGLILCGVFLGIARAGVNAQIRSARATLLTVSPDRLTWISDIGQSELLFRDIAAVTVRNRFGRTHSLLLKLSQGKAMTLHGYERMDEIVDCLEANLPAELFDTHEWFLF